MKVDQFLQSGAIFASEKEKITVGYGLVKSASTPQSSMAFYTPDFFLNTKKPWLHFQYYKTLAKEELQNSLEKYAEKWSLPITNPDFTHFSQQFHLLQKLFSQGELSKAVPYLFDRIQDKVTSKKLAYSILQLLNYLTDSSLYLYGTWNSKTGILGATPELLFASQPHKITTMACAGTKPLSESFNESIKDQIEHQIVVQDIQQQLSHFGPPSLHPCQEVIYPGLKHLITPISVSSATTPTFQEIVQHLHPTPALGTFPRKEGLQWLRAYQEKQPRERFGAPFALKEGDRYTCVVAIRNLQWHDQTIKIGAGCGIVKKSQLEMEKDEICLKLKTVKQMLTEPLLTKSSTKH